jgi:hypothetical protein
MMSLARATPSTSKRARSAPKMRTAGEGARPELGQTFKLTPDQRTEESHPTTTI